LILSRSSWQEKTGGQELLERRKKETGAPGKEKKGGKELLSPFCSWTGDLLFSQDLARISQHWADIRSRGYR